MRPNAASSVEENLEHKTSLELWSLWTMWTIVVVCSSLVMRVGSTVSLCGRWSIVHIATHLTISLVAQTWVEAAVHLLECHRGTVVPPPEHCSRCASSNLLIQSHAVAQQREGLQQ